ncbi:MAG: outer membrane beta-barrel protein, partial [Candidatus Tectomicrobia bacterium]
LLYLILALIGVDHHVLAQQTTAPSDSVPTIAGPLPSPQERILSPIPMQFNWMSREVRPNPLLEALLSLQEGPVRLFIPVTLAEEFSDNFFQDNDEMEEYRTSIGTGAVFRLERGRSFVSLANTTNVTYDARAEESDFGFANLSLNVGHQLPRLSLALNESFVRDNDPDLADSAGTRRGRRTFLRNRVSPQMRYAFSRLTSMTLGYTNTLVEVEGGVNGDDSITHTVATDIQHQFSRVLTGRISYAFTADDSDGAADTQAHDASVDMGYTFDPRTSFALRAFGSVTDRSNGGEDSQTYGASFGLRRQFTSFLGAFVSIGATVFEEEGDDPEVRLNWQVNLDGDLPFSRRTSLTLNSRQEVADTTGNVDAVGIVLSQSVSLTLNHVVSRALLTSLFVNYTRTEFLEDSVGTSGAVKGREDNFWRAGARASYALTRVWSLSLVYLYRRRDSNLRDSDFDENRVTFTLSGNVPVL